MTHIGFIYVNKGFIGERGQFLRNCCNGEGLGKRTVKELYVSNVYEVFISIFTLFKFKEI